MARSYDAADHRWGVMLVAPQAELHHVLDHRDYPSALEPGPSYRSKPPFKPKHIRASRTRLQHEGRTRDLAPFNTAIDGHTMFSARLRESTVAKEL